MKNKCNSRITFIFSLTVCVIIQACSGVKNTSGSKNIRVYNNANLETMVNVVGQAIRSRGLTVTNLDKNNEEKRTILTFVDQGDNTSSNIQNTGYVYITKVDTANAVQVEVKNPTYHYSVPMNDRKDYSTVLFLEIDRILGKNKIY